MSHFSVRTSGAVAEHTDICTCGYPDCGGYSMHEPHCGMELVGFLPREAAASPFDPHPCPTLLPSALWDMGGLDITPENGDTR